MWRKGFAGELLSGSDAGVVGPGTLPLEYAAPPIAWRLGPALAELTGDLDEHSAQRFLSFLSRSGVHLSADATAPRLASVADPVDSTRVEAVCGTDDRPLALWLRTPEPLDWRRVHVVGRLRHVISEADCPTGYAHRTPLELEIRLLPSTDGSQALLVACFAGVCIHFARGELTLTITYRSDPPGLPPLRPADNSAGNEERVVMTFLQPFGSPWPLPRPRTGPPLPYETQPARPLDMSDVSTRRP